MTSLKNIAPYLGAELIYISEQIYIYQRGYLTKIMRKYGMDNYNSLNVPISLRCTCKKTIMDFLFTKPKLFQ